MTLTGTGGIGKTRLAVEAALALSDRYPDGAWLVELAPITEPWMIPTAVGNTLQLRAAERESIEDAVIRYLRNRHIVLVLDNCEHVLEGANAIVGSILAATPNSRVLATSRESLGVAGEVVMNVGPLSAEGPGEPEALALILDRVAAFRPGYVAPDEDLAALARICQTVDGIPLALELAAARLRTVSPAELASRLVESFEHLAGSPKTTPHRQRTLDATIRWSFDTLTGQERRLFEAVSVFAGDFGLDAAEALARAIEIDGTDTLILLDSLVDKSMVQPNHQSNRPTRYRLLEPVRRFGRRHLESQPRLDRLLELHAAWHEDWVRRMSPQVRGPGQIDALRQLSASHDDIRLAHRTLLAAGEVDRYLRMAFDLFQFWNLRALFREGAESVLSGLEQATHVDAEAEVQAWFTVAALTAQLGDPSSVDHARSGLEIARTAADPNLIGRMELQLGAALRETTTDTDYVNHVREARRLLEAHPEPRWWEPAWEDALNNRTFHNLLPLDDPRSAEHLQAAVRGFTEAGDEAMAAHVAASLSRESETLEDDLKRAAVTLRRLGDDVGHRSIQTDLGLLLIRNGRLDEAVELLRDHLGPLRDASNISFWAFASAMLAGAEAEIGSTKQAAQRLTELIDLLPTLPRAEWILARVFDASAATLASAERPEDAAVVLGKARAVPFTLNTIYPREIVQTPILERLNETLNEGTLTTLLEEGATMTDASGLEVTEAWLEECADASNESGRITPAGQ